MILWKVQEALTKYDEVVFTEEFIRIPKQQLVITFIGEYYRFQNHKEMIDPNLFVDHVKWQNNDSQVLPDLTLIHEFSREIEHDGFKLSINSELNQIRIISFNKRGFQYALNLLSKLIIKKDDNHFIPILEVTHTPSFALRGVIEGFYGVPWTHRTRLDMLHFLNKIGMNTYMYAPKDDDYQRKLWREPYPIPKLEEFQELIGLSDTLQVDFWYMISPGNDINVLNQKDLVDIEEKLQQMIDLGVVKFGLLMDDIDYTLSGSMKKRFYSNADMHAYLINYVYDFLVKQIPHVELVVCPTEYDNHADSYYLMRLAELTNPKVPFFWTGPSTLAKQISKEDIRKMSQVYNREMIIWDNVPVNDFEKDHELLFLSPYKHRSKALSDRAYQVKGIVLNPMAQWELSKFSVASSAQFMWQTHSFEANYDMAKVYRLWTDKAEVMDSLAIFCHHFKNRHVEPLRDIDLNLAIEKGDTQVLGDVLKELTDAAEKIQTIEHDSFQTEVSPWIKRISLEWDFWKALMNHDDDNVKQSLEVLKTMPYRVGSNIPLTYYKYHMLNKINDSQENHS